MQADLELETNSTGGALVAQGFQLMKFENDSMLAIAISRPREEEKIIAKALRELEIAPEQAKAAFYEIPYQERQDDGTYKTVKVTGPSIKAAMALARRWGNCSVTARIVSEDVSGFNLEGVYLDFETNYRVSRPMRVSKSFKTRAKKIIELDPKRLEAAIQAGASRALRNVTTAGLPAYLVGAYDQKAREITGGKLDQPAETKTVQAIIRSFAKMKVTQAQLETYVDELPMGQWTGNEVASLRGIWNAISDGQITVDDAFPVTTGDDESSRDGAGTGAAVLTPESLSGGAVTGQNDAQRKATDLESPKVIPESQEVPPQPESALEGTGGPENGHEPGPHATPNQLDTLESLAGTIGEDAVTEVKTLRTRHKQVSLSVYQEVRGRLLVRQAEIVNASKVKGS